MDRIRNGHAHARRRSCRPPCRVGDATPTGNGRRVRSVNRPEGAEPGMTEVDKLMMVLPAKFSVVIQPGSKMGRSLGATFFWPRCEIWIAARGALDMKRTLAHEVAHALTPGHGHDRVWYEACCRVWDAVFPDRQGFSENIACRSEERRVGKE